MKTVLKVLLAVIILVLSYAIFESIMKPVRFDREKSLRYEGVVQALKDIRDAERLFRQHNKRYTASWDSLVNYMKTGTIPVVKMIPDPKDTTFTRSISDTIGRVAILDSLFGKRANFDINNLSLIPGTNGQKFELEAGKIDKGGLKVDVFEARAHNDVILDGLDSQLIRNLNKGLEDINRFPGLKVGSMLEVTTDGNWE